MEESVLHAHLSSQRCVSSFQLPASRSAGLEAGTATGFHPSAHKTRAGDPRFVALAFRACEEIVWCPPLAADLTWSGFHPSAHKTRAGDPG